MHEHSLSKITQDFFKKNRHQTAEAPGKQSSLKHYRIFLWSKIDNQLLKFLMNNLDDLK